MRSIYLSIIIAILLGACAPSRIIDAVKPFTDRALLEARKIRCSLPMSAVERNCADERWCIGHFLSCPAPNIEKVRAVIVELKIKVPEAKSELPQ